MSLKPQTIPPVSVMRWTSPVSGAAAPHDGQDVFHQGDCAMSAAFIGLDLAKSVFQVHGVDAQGKVVVTREQQEPWGVG